MAYRTEERFSYVYTVSALRQFLLEKKRKLNSDINSKMICEDNIAKAKSYVKILDSILKSEYFVGKNLSMKVYQLMDRLKKEDVIFKEEIGKLEAKIAEMEYYMENAIEHTVSDEFNIPDEECDYAEAIMRKKQEYKWKIEAVRDELNGYNYRLKLCRDLKGIICRPNGFFSSIYRN